MIYYGLYVALVVSVVLTAYYRRDTLLYAAALLMPLTQRMPSPVPVLGAPANLIALGLIVAAWRLPRYSEGTPPRLAFRRLLTLLVVILLIGLMIRGFSELYGQWYRETYTDACQVVWNWLLPIVVFTTTFRLTRTPEIATKIIRCCQVSICAQCGIVFVDILQGAGRATAFLVEPNRAGSYFASATALFLTYLLLKKGTSRWLYCGAAILSAAAMLNTLSRGGMVATAVATTCVLLTFYATARKAMGTKMIFALAAAILVINASLFLPAKVVDRVLFTFKGNEPLESEDVELEASAAERVIIWQAAWQAFLERPIGYGTQSFIVVTFQRSHLAKAAHNIYLQFLVEYGVQGFLVLLLLVFTVPTVLLRLYSSSTDERAKCRALSLAGWWIAHCVAHVFTNSFFNLLVVGQFWMMLACVFGSAGRESRAPETRPGPAFRRWPQRRRVRVVPRGSSGDAPRHVKTLADAVA